MCRLNRGQCFLSHRALCPDRSHYRSVMTERFLQLWSCQLILYVSFHTERWRRGSECNMRSTPGQCVFTCVLFIFDLICLVSEKSCWESDTVYAKRLSVFSFQLKELHSEFRLRIKELHIQWGAVSAKWKWVCEPADFILDRCPLQETWT